MPLEISKTINDLADSVARIPIVNTIAGNPLYTAFFSTLLVVIVIVIIFRGIDDPENTEPIITLVSRAAFYILILLTVLQFVHNRILMDEVLHSNKLNDVSSLINGAFDYDISDDIVPINIEAIDF